MKRRLTALAGVLLAAAVLAAPVPPARAQAGDDLVLQARDALRAKDKARLATLRDSAIAANHPLAMWVHYFELGNRLADAQQPELEAFATRWAGTYVEDRLRNDWLLELGRRRDWANFRTEFPRFREPVRYHVGTDDFSDPVFPRKRNMHLAHCAETDYEKCFSAGDADSL
jgi:hypothetical protein